MIKDIFSFLTTEHIEIPHNRNISKVVMASSSGLLWVTEQYLFCANNPCRKIRIPLLVKTLCLFFMYLLIQKQLLTIDTFKYNLPFRNYLRAICATIVNLSVFL